MPTYTYVRTIDDIHRSIETGTPSKGPSIGPIRRDFFPVTSYTGVRINVPLKYLASTASIHVTGDEQCSVHGPNVFLVHIRNGVVVSDLSRAKLNSNVQKAAGFLLEEAIDKGVDEAVDKSGLGSRISGKARNAVHGKIHSSLSKVGRSVGASFKTTQTIANGLSATAGTVGRHAVTSGIANGISTAVGGVGIWSLALESTTTGADASLYDRSYTGKASNGTGVTFFVKGQPD